MIYPTLFSLLYLCAPHYDLNPAEIQDLIHTGLEFTYVEEFDSAQTYFDKVIALYPDNPAGYFLMATLLQLQMMDECHNAYEDEYLSFVKKSTKIAEQILAEEENTWAEFYIGNSYINRAFYEGFKGNYFEAFKQTIKASRILKSVVHKDSTFYDAYFGIGAFEYFWARVTRYIPLLKLADGKVSEAIRQLHIAADKSIYSGPMAKNVLASIYGEEGEFAKADSIIDRLLVDYSESRVFLWNKVQLTFKQKDYVHAADLYNKLFAMYDGHNKKNYANLAYCKLYVGKCLYELGQKDKSKQALKEVIEYKQHATEYPQIKDYCREAYSLLSRML